MPRKTDAANLDNPLRKLRQQFEITQDRLGELLGLNGDAIRNLENGRMKISVRIFRRIMLALGAEFRSKRQAWFVPLSRTLCSPATLFAWRQASSEPDENLKTKDHECLCYRIDVLLKSVNPRQYHTLFTKIYEFLDDCLREHPSPEASEAFKRSTPTMTIVRKPGTRPIIEEEELVPPLPTESRSLQVPDEGWVVQRPLVISKITRTYHDFPSAELKQNPGTELKQKRQSSKHRTSAA
jgi:transcriptional regulator with XRE-family HTH domain